MGGEDYGCLMISDRFGQDDKTPKKHTKDIMKNYLNSYIEYDYPYFY